MKQRIAAFYNSLVDRAVNQTRLDALAQDVRDMQAIADPVERAVTINAALRDKKLPSEQLGGLMDKKASNTLSKFLAPASLVMACIGLASALVSVPAIILLTTIVLAVGTMYGTAKFDADIMRRFQPHYRTLQDDVFAISNSRDIESLQKSPHFAAAVKEFPNVKYAFGQYASKRAIEALEQQPAVPARTTTRCL